jgi:hypothetical protein
MGGILPVLTSAKGHEERFPVPGLNGRNRFGNRSARAFETGSKSG